MDKNLKHSVDYITSKTGGKSGFSVPKGYFNSIEDKVFTNIFEDKLPNQKPFDVPKDYFTNLEDTIVAKVTSEDKKDVKIISLRQRILYIIPYTSVASILLFVGAYFFNNYNSSVTFDDITITDIENWYDNSYETIDSEELAMVLTENDLNENDFLTTTNDIELEDYLDKIDLNSLNEIQ